MIDADSHFNLPDPAKNPYRPELFVNRKQELKMVEEKVQQRWDGSSIFQPFINWWGVVGVGKTWLLKHIEAEYQYSPQTKPGSDLATCTFYYSFEESEIPAAQLKLVIFIKTLAQRVTENIAGLVLGEEVGSNLGRAAEFGLARPLADAIVTLAKDCLPIVLLDATEVLPEPFWKELEKELLEPLLESNQVLVIISGRRRVPRWGLVEVRRRATPLSMSQVQPFDADSILEQSEANGLRVDQDFAEKVEKLTAGNPQLIQQLISYFKSTGQPTTLDQPDSQVTNDILHYLKLYEKENLQSVKPELQNYLRRLMPLRFYRVEALRFILPKEDEQRRLLTDVRLVGLLRELSETTIVWWNEDQNGYVTAPMLRQVMNQRLYLEDRAAFAESHSRALALYSEWADRYPENNDVYLAEIAFHQAWLHAAGGKNDAETIKGLDGMIDLAQKLEPAKQRQLREKVNNDPELKQVLKPAVHQQLVARLPLGSPNGTEQSNGG